MLLFLQIYFVVMSLILFLYSITTKLRAVHSFGLGLIINIYPLFWVPYQSMDIARIMGIPIAYLPIISAGFALFFYTGFSVKQVHKKIFFLAVIFLVYAAFTTFIHGFTFKNFAYWMSWPLNFLIFFAATSFFSNVKFNISQKVIRATIIILIIGCLIGIFRFLVGISADANFMPVVNRNGTVVFIVMLLPLLFYLNSVGKISKNNLIIAYLIILLTLVFIFSRSGMIGAFFGLMLYYLRMTPKNMIIVSFMVLVIGLLMTMNTGFKAFDRLGNTVKTVEKIVNNKTFEAGESDFSRVMLMQSAINISKKNFWFGTGLGIENYRREFHKVSSYYKASKAHNFYLSYFAELGLIGFSILILFFGAIYRAILPMSSKYRSFRVSFWCIALMMTMNEYILLPEIWFFLGIMTGISYRVRSDEKRFLAGRVKK